jgi:hypothetical protein
MNESKDPKNQMGFSFIINGTQNINNEKTQFWKQYPPAHDDHDMVRR